MAQRNVILSGVSYVYPSITFGLVIPLKESPRSGPNSVTAPAFLSFTGKGHVCAPSQKHMY